MSEEKATASMIDKDRGIAFVVLAISFNMVGLSSLAFGNVPVAAGLLIGSLVFLLFSLFYLTKEDRQMKRKKKMDIS
jgi:cell division protein FtsW (lipid II flippase)